MCRLLGCLRLLRDLQLYSVFLFYRWLLSICGLLGSEFTYGVLRNLPPAANRVSLPLYLLRFEHLQDSALADPKDLGSFRYRVRILNTWVVSLSRTSPMH